MKKPYLETGKIVGTHGVRGEMRLQPWSDTPADTARLPVLYLDAAGTQTLDVESMRVHGNMILLKAKDVTDIDAAQRYRNRIVYADRNHLRLQEGQYFIQDLLGCRVYDVDTEQFYGTISDVSPTGANDVWHIQTEQNAEILIPNIPDVVCRVDVDEERIEIRPLKGMIE